MNQAQVDYAALRFKSAKDLSSVANDIKSGRVAVETVYVQRLGKRIMKFRCPPGTRRGGQWTDRLGTDCNLGPARAGLAKITRTVSRVDNALEEAEKRKLSGGPGLVRYQAGRAAERAGEVVDYAAQRTREGVGRAVERTGEVIDNAADAIRKRGQATRVRMGRALEAAGEAIDRATERLGEAYERTKERVGVALERAGEAWDDRADRGRIQQAAETAGNLLSAGEKAQAIEDLADQLHEAWRQTRKNPDGTFEPRLKDDGNGGEVDIANTRYKDLPEKWQAENKAAATQVVEAIDSNPNASDDEIAAMVHEGWLERNGEWAPDELKVDYADLPQDEKDKDLAIVEQARANIAKQTVARTAKKPDAQKPNGPQTPKPSKKNPKTVDPEKAQAELERLRPFLKKPKPEADAPTAETVAPEDTFVPAPPDANMPEADAPEADAPEVDAPEADVPETEVDVFVPAPPDASPADLPEPEKQPIPEPDSGKVPTAERTVIKKPEDGKKPSGPSKAAGASLDDANAKNAKKTKKKLPGKKFGSVFTKEDNAKKWAKETAVKEGFDIYVAKGPDGKFRLFDEEMFVASGFDAVAVYNSFGGEIDLPSKDLYPDATPEDLVEDVKIAREKALEAALAETAELATPNPAISLELKKSKTGKFLPDDFSPKTLGYGNTAFQGATAEMIAFENAWDKQQQDVLDFWEKRVGSINSPQEGLEAIDTYIQQKIDAGENPGKIGVLRAERNNYIAMIVPNAGDEDDNFIDPYQRVNYVGPKRREMIISDAGLEDYVVGKSKGKKADKDLGEPSDADSVLPTYVVQPDSTLHPISQLNNVLNDNDAPGKAMKMAADMKKGDFAEFRDADQNLDAGKFNAGRDAAWQEFDAYYSAMTFKLHSKEGLTQEEVDKLVDLRARYEAHEAASTDFHNALNMQQMDDPDYDTVEPELDDQDSLIVKNNDFILNAENDFAVYGVAQHEFELWAESMISMPEFKDEEALNTWYDAKILSAEGSVYNGESILDLKKMSEEVTTDDVINHKLLPEMKKEWWEDAKQKALAKLKADDSNVTAELKNSAMEQSNLDPIYFHTVMYDDGAGVNTVASVAVTGSSIDWLSTAVDDEIFYMGKKINFEEAKKIADEKKKAITDEIADAAEQAAAEAAVNANVQAILDATPDAQPVPLASHIDFDATGKVAALKAIFDAEPGFDYAKITDHEGARLGTTLDSILARVTSKKYAEEAKKFIDALPDNLGELSPEEQLAAIRSAVGVSDNLSAAKFLSRAAYNAQYGSKENLSNLKAMLAGYGPNVLPSNKKKMIEADYTDEIAAATSELTKAMERFKALPLDMPAAVRDFYKGTVNDARTRLVNSLLGEHLKSIDSGDTSKMAQSGKRLAAEVAQMDDAIRTDIEKTINNGISVVAGSPDSQSGKGAITTSGFNSGVLGTVQADGKAIAYAIPIGHNGIWTQEDASEHLLTGGNLSTVPDEFLKDAIWSNTGNNKRFRKIDDGTVAGGFNDHGQSEKDKTTGFVDTVTGSRFVIKTAHRNNQEHIQEVAAARVSQILGNPSTGIRFGSGPLQKELPGPQQAAEGQKMGDQRAIVMEHVANLFQGQDYEVLGHLHDIGQLPKGTKLDGESVARMMVLDRSLNYFDRTSTNVVAVKGPDGRVHLHPIDHGNGFRGFEGGDEQAAGFIKPGKPDSNQLKLMQLAKALDPEERERFAATLNDSVRRFKRTDFDAEFKDIADRMGVSAKERERLEKHAKYLEDKKKVLDYEAMTDQVLKQLGFSQEQIDSFKVPPSAGAGDVVAGFGTPKGAVTVQNFQPRLATMPSRSQYVTMNYGGDQIEDMEVRVQRLRFKPRGANANAQYQEGTQMVFKRRGDNGIVPTDGTWDEIAKGHVSVAGAGDSAVSGTAMTKTKEGKEVATINLSNPSTAPGTITYNGGMKTYMKTLDDGTIILLTHGAGKYGAKGTQTVFGTSPQEKNLRGSTPHQTVRVIFPGDQKDVTPERIAAAMEAVGITEHGEPTPEQIRNRGIRAMYATLFGRVPEGKTTGQLINDLSTKYKITEDDFESRTTDTGKILPMISAEAAQRLYDRPSVTAKTIQHSMTNISGINDVILSGGVISTLRRFDHGADREGSSSKQDMAVTGGGDFVYTYKNSSPLHTQSVGTGSWYAPSVIMMRRTDYHAYDHDAWGHWENYQDIDTGMQAGGYSANEVDFKGMLDMSMGILVVSDSERTTILQNAAASGRTHVNGVPLEDLVATPATFQQKLEMLYKRWGFDWPPKS